MSIMFKTLRAVFALNVLGLVFCAIAYAGPPSIEALSKSPFIISIHASPDGNYFAARLGNDPHATFSVFRWRDGVPEPLVQAHENDEFFIEGFEWVKNDTLLVRAGRLGGGRISVYVDGKYERYAGSYASALYVFNAGDDGAGDQKPLWKLADRGGLVSVLPDDPDHILLQHSRGQSSPHVYRVNIRNDQKWERVHKGVRDIHTWRADRNGAIRIGYGNKRNGDRLLIVRSEGADEFRDISHLVDDVDKRFQLVSFAEDADQFYALSNHETDTQALYRFNIETGAFVEQVYHNPDFDVSGVIVSPRTGVLKAVSFEAEETRTVWFNEDLKSDIKGIERQFPDYAANIISFNENISYGVIGLSAPNYPGQYYFYDRVAKRLTGLPEQYSELRMEDLGAQFAREYEARDGVSIPAFITLPPGVESLEAARGLPFIIMPHGGPAARDFAVFDMWVQSYATLGYGVLQMNFRGSAGYGLSFERAGRQQWGELMQDDITDGVKWLVENNIADPDRIAIVGASYGGYAALMGAIKTPELFQCAVSFAGVSDLVDLVKDAERSSYVVRLIGDRFSQSDYLLENSPAHRTRDIAIPVMLLHGRLDSIVPYAHSELLYDRMRPRGQPVEFVTMPRSGHSFYHDYDDRVRFFTRQREYIRSCLGEAR